MWKLLFQDHILGRGLDYFIQNLVEDVYIEKNKIEATVYGTEKYEVEIIKEDEEIIELGCDCPYADSGNNCKHMAAVLFYLEDKEKVFVAKDTETSITKLVEKADMIEVKNFLIEILKYDEKLYNRFKARLGCDISPTDMKGYKRQVDDIFEQYGGYDDFVNYKNAWDFISDLEEILDNDIQGMLDNNQLEEAFELTNYIFIKLANQDMDDSDGGTSQIANSCFEIWEAILDKSSIGFRRYMYNWFTGHLDGSVIDYMEDYIEEILFYAFKEDEFMEEKIIFLDNKIGAYKQEEDSWFYSYELGVMILRRINIMEEMGANQDIIEDYYKENLEFNQVRKYYIDICITRKDYDMAIKLLKEGKEKENDRAGVVLDYSLKLKDLYKETGQDRLYREELWLLILNYKAGDLNLYKELKSLYTDEEWVDKREIIFKKLLKYGGVGKLYEFEGLYDRLVDLVINSHGLYTLHEYEDVLKDLYPKELLDKYVDTVEEMAKTTSGRGRYREIVSTLRKMNKYPGGKERVSGLVTEWKLKYRNRPAMMDELSRL